MSAELQSHDIDAWLEEARVWAEEVLGRVMPPTGAHPARLTEAMRYALFGGGKRLRPALVRLVCEELGGDPRDAEAPAAAIECVHTYSLVHDDLPCMDDDDLRRGRPTCHIAFDEATAVLAGDALLTFAFQLLAGMGGERAARSSAALARASGAFGMVGGQVLDLMGEAGIEDAGQALAGVRDTHLRKTAMLFGCAAEMGAIAAGEGPEGSGLARAYGTALGLAFQAADDLLDVTGDAATLGKTPGKDAALERSTLVAVLGFEGAQKEATRLAQAAREAAGAAGLGTSSRAVAFAQRMIERRA